MRKMYNIEFIRAVCALGIICFHFSSHCEKEYHFMCSFGNVDMGHVFVIIFFILSGGMIYINNREITSLKLFYYKRWKSIIPSFYIAFSILFLCHVFKSGTFFYNQSANPFSIILSVLGMDGYFLYAIPNYYILGEWFLGAIIILYVLYPILLYGINKYPWHFFVIISCLFCSVMIKNVFEIVQIRNLFTCIFTFYIGMMIFKYSFILKKKIILIVSLIIMALFYFLPIYRGFGVFFEEIFGIAFYIVLYHLGNAIVSVNILKKIFIFLGKISYQVFLLQHVIILFILKRYNPVGLMAYWIILAITILLITICALLLNKITSFVMESSPYKDFEKFILKTNE